MAARNSGSQSTEILFDAILFLETSLEDNDIISLSPMDQLESDPLHSNWIYVLLIKVCTFHVIWERLFDYHLLRAGDIFHRPDCRRSL